MSSYYTDDRPNNGNDTIERKSNDSNSVASPNKRPRRLSEHDFDNVPRVPRAELLIEHNSVQPKVAGKPHIFIPSARAVGANIHHMEQMLKRAGFSVGTVLVRADRTGYFLVFEDSEKGKRRARDCFDRFQGRKFKRLTMRMKLFV